MKKPVKILLIILVLLIAVWLMCFAVDYTRVQKQEKPIFCFTSSSKAYADGGTIEYIGLGYKVIDFNMLNGYDDMKIGTWFMKYDDFAEEYQSYENSNMSATLSAVVMEVHDSSLSVMEIKGGQPSNELYFVSFANDGNIGFAKGQEVLIYFDGSVAESFPAQIHNVGKIEITEKKTEITIPDNVLRYYNNTKDKVDVNVSELTTKSISITVVDTNELPYEYAAEYTIYKEVKNEDYTGTGEKIGEDTENSTAGYTGTGAEYIWKELNKNSDVKMEDTMEDLIYNLPNMPENEPYKIIGKKINWENLYGELTDGKYRLVFSNSGSFPITIEFSVDNGETEITKIEK